MCYLSSHTQADGKRACPRQGNSPSSLCPLASVQAPREQLGSLTPAVPNSFKFTSLSAFKGGFDKCIALCSQPGSNCQEDYDKLFSCFFKTIWRTVCPPGADTPQPCCSQAQRRQQGAKFTLITALIWGCWVGVQPKCCGLTLTADLWVTCAAGEPCAKAAPPSILAPLGPRESQQQSCLVGR